MGENGDFQPLHPKISRNSQTVSNRQRLLNNTINWKFAVDFFARGLRTRTAVARLPLRQLDFLVTYKFYRLGICPNVGFVHSVTKVKIKLSY